MVIFSILAFIAFIIYTVTKNNSSNSSDYSSHQKSMYNGLVGEDRLRVDLMADIRRVVEQSLGYCKEQRFSEHKTNNYLIFTLGHFKNRMKEDMFKTASIYRIPVREVEYAIEEMCGGALETYIRKSL